MNIPGAYVKVPDSLVNSKLGLAEKVVWIALAHFANERGECFPSVSTIAKFARVSDRTVQRALLMLAHGAWVTICRNKHSKVTQYRLHVHGGRNLTDNIVKGCQNVTGDKLSPIEPEHSIMPFPQGGHTTICHPSENCEGVTNCHPNSLKDLKDPPIAPQIDEVLAYLNQQTGKSIRNPGPIGARLKEGYTVEQLKSVINKKVKEWTEPKMRVFLRPSTLFCLKHFDEYLNQEIHTTSSRGVTDPHAWDDIKGW